MTNQELKALRDSLKLSRAKFCQLLWCPLTKRSIAPYTLYTWERRLPEVFELAPWVEHAAKVLVAKGIRLGYLEAPLPRPYVAHKHGNSWRYWEELDADGKPMWKNV